ncbi:MAG: WD40/YVTN/BNR-like repeat-containing protein [Salibacteraceae bacterium]
MKSSNIILNGLYLLIITLIFSSCSVFEEEEEFNYSFEVDDIHSEIHFRGVSAVNDSVCWLSGTKGTVLLTKDRGESWSKMIIPKNADVDLRDIHAFNSKKAIVMGIGSPAKIFKTEDGGKTWYMTYFNDHADIFLDGIAFFNDKEGVAMGDAIDHRIVILKTKDGGDTWNLEPIMNLPKALEDEGAFAASGTNMITHADNEIYIGLGYPKGRLIYSHDKGKNWDYYLTGMGNGEDSRGIYSLDFDNDGNGIIIGGDWKKVDNKDLVAATSHDKGLHWEIITEETPAGYRSAVQFIKNTPWAICTGPNGTDYSNDKGMTWKPAKTEGGNCISFSSTGKTGWIGGNNGRIITVKEIRH